MAAIPTAMFMPIPRPPDNGRVPIWRSRTVMVSSDLLAPLRETVRAEPSGAR